MAGLEVVVRPVVFPSIRPQPARSLPPADDPEKGFCEIKGTSSFVVSFSNSTSWSASYGKTKEIKRRVDEVRVYQEDDDGTVNEKNFVDIEVTNKLWKEGGTKPAAGFNGDDVVSTTPGRGYNGNDIVPKGNKGGGTEISADNYCPSHKEKKNVEVKKKNVIKKC